MVVPGAETVLPNGRLLTPIGQRLWAHEGLWHLSVSKDGGTVVALCVGDAYREVHKPQLVVFTDVKGQLPRRKVVKLPSMAPAGIFDEARQRYIVSTGDAGGLAAYARSSWKLMSKVSLAPFGMNDAYLNDLVLSKDGHYLYAADVARQHIIVFDARTLKPIRSIPAGRQPYAMALSQDGKRLLVANIGIFNYSQIPAPGAHSPNPKGLNRPAFAYPSKEAMSGAWQEGRLIPGLGRAATLEAQSVWSYDLTNPTKPTVLVKAKSGFPIREVSQGKFIGGSSPNAILIHGREVFVANANNDTISVFDDRSLKLKRTIRLEPIPGLEGLRGVIPTSMAMSKDGNRLYVCESGLNAVAIVHPKSGVVLGHIPTGYWPVKVALSRNDSQVLVANQKGLGQGPLGHLHPRPKSDERYGLSEMPGLVQRLPAPEKHSLADLSRRVLRNLGGLPEQSRTDTSRTNSAMRTHIKHVVFITKENHTFDGIFGGFPGARSEPRYAEFGDRGWVRERDRNQPRSIMPNHIRLAKQFSIGDNFYMEPYASGDGHRWLVGNYNSLWSNRMFYAGWEFRKGTSAKGRLSSFSSYGSQIPEDYLENGSMWEHLDRQGVSFRNYGEGYELPAAEQGVPKSKTGQTYFVNHPMPLALYKNTSFEFPAYNTNIPDIARADWFIEDLERYRKKHGGIPKFLNIAICNDHGASPMPSRGYPFLSSFMADNDLALGRIVEYLSHLPEWNSMAIFVTQDDPGSDSDSVDRHRSFVLAISPYAKRGHVSQVHTSIMSMIKSLYLVLGLGPNNLFDALAESLDDHFQSTPDFTPYESVVPDRRVFRAEDTFDPTDPKFERRRREASVALDNPFFAKALRDQAAPPSRVKKSEQKPPLR